MTTIMFPRQHKAKQNRARRYDLIFLFVVTAFNIHGLCEVISYTQCSAPVYPRCARLRWLLESKLLQLRCQPIVRYATLFLVMSRLPKSCYYILHIHISNHICISYSVMSKWTSPSLRLDAGYREERRETREWDWEQFDRVQHSPTRRHAASWPVRRTSDPRPHASRHTASMSFFTKGLAHKTQHFHCLDTILCSSSRITVA